MQREMERQNVPGCQAGRHLQFCNVVAERSGALVLLETGNCGLIPARLSYKTEVQFPFKERGAGIIPPIRKHALVSL